MCATASLNTGLSHAIHAAEMALRKTHNDRFVTKRLLKSIGIYRDLQALRLILARRLYDAADWHFVGDSTVRNVFSTLCVLLDAEVPVRCLSNATGFDVSQFGKFCGCSGRLGQTRINAFYHTRLWSHDPLAPLKSQLSAQRSVVFAGIGFWIMWPTPFSPASNWEGFFAWRDYEASLTRMHDLLFPVARAVHLVNAHSLCNWGARCNGKDWPFSSRSNSSSTFLSPCVGGLLTLSGVRSRRIATSYCTRGVRCETNIRMLNRRMLYWALQLPVRTTPIDTHALTKGRCWANDRREDNAHFRRLLAHELALYIDKAWPGSTAGFGARRPR